MGHSASLLTDGTVLVVGGGQDDAELFDPDSGTWQMTSALVAGVNPHTASVLLDGRVLLLGPDASQMYEPLNHRWTLTEGGAARGHRATVLTDGRVLATGGAPLPCAYMMSPAGAYLFDPTTESWGDGGAMWRVRGGHAATLLRSGQVLVTGGWDCGFHQLVFKYSSAQRFDPTTLTWTSLPSMTEARIGHTATELPDGRVLVAGGTAELYEPCADGLADDDHDGVICDQDCDDGNGARFPGAEEACDGVDNDCSDGIPLEELDADGDGWTVCSGDCRGMDGDAFPGAEEVCNHADDDCDGLIDDDCLGDAGDTDRPPATGCACDSGDPNLGRLVYVAFAGAFIRRIARHRSTNGN